MEPMARLQFGRLTEAWKGEATDFTPLLAEQIDAVGGAIGVDLASLGKSEVQTTGGRRIDILAQGKMALSSSSRISTDEPTMTTSPEVLRMP